MDTNYILLQWDNFKMVYCPLHDLQNYLFILRRDRKQDYFKIEFCGGGYWIKQDDRN